MNSEHENEQNKSSDEQGYRLSPAERNKQRRQNLRIIGVFTACLMVFIIIYRINDVTGALWWLTGILTPILMGLAFAFVLNPMYEFFRRKLTKAFSKPTKKGLRQPKRIYKLSKGLGITITISIGVAIVAALLLLIIPQFITSLIGFAEKAPGYFDELEDWISQRGTSDKLNKLVDESIKYITEWLRNGIAASLQDIATRVYESVLDVLLFLYNFFIAIIVAVYALAEKERSVKQIKKILFAVLSPKTANETLKIARYGNEMFGGFISAKLLDSLIMGILCFIGMSIFGFPYAILVSVIIGITNIIPFFGPIIGAIPSTAIIMLSDFWQGVFFVIFIIVLQQIDGNIIGPRILGTKTGVSAFWIIFSLLIFNALFGFVGMLIAIPLFAVIYYIVRQLVNRQLTKKDMPIDGEAYLNSESYDPLTKEFVPLSAKEHEHQSFKEQFLGIFKKKKFKNH